MALFFKSKPKKDIPLLALDIGTDSVKAMLFLVDGEKAVVKGFGEHKQGATQMRGGVISDLEGVIDNCDAAITQAANQAGVSPQKLILGIAGQTIKGVATFFRFERTEPEEKISQDEVKEIVTRIQETALNTAREEIQLETGGSNLQLKLVNSSIISAKVDNFEVPSLLGFKGKDVEIGFFDAYTTSVQLETLESLADELGLDIHAITAEPFSLVSGILPSEKESLSGIILDIGGLVTEITLVKQGRILGVKVLPLGGRVISERIAADLKIPFEEAESKKIQYAANEVEPTLKRKIKEIISQEIDLWLTGVEVAISGFASDESLPPQFLLAGGGSSLPEIKSSLVAHPWLKKLPFSQFPKIEYILPDNVLAVFDQTGSLTDHTKVTSMALCKVALDLDKEEDEISKLLSKTAQKMGI